MFNPGSALIVNDEDDLKQLGSHVPSFPELENGRTVAAPSPAFYDEIN